MRHPSIKALYEYWNGLRGSRLAPTRAELDPKQIAQELGDIFLLEGSAEDFSFRLAGSRMVASLGQALTGKSFDTIWLANARTSARRALASASEEGEPVLVGIRAYEPMQANNPPDRPRKPSPVEVSQWLQPRWPNLRVADSTNQQERRGTLISAGEMLLLPLRHQERAGARVLGALALFELPILPATAPNPLDVSGVRILSRTAMRHAGTGLITGNVSENVITRRGHLTVIKGSDAPRG